MPTTITADEVNEFTHAVAGVEIDFVRTDQGFGPARMVNSGPPEVMSSVGGLDFSAYMESEAPAGVLVVQHIFRNPGGLVSMCGVPSDPRRPAVFAAGTTVFGRLPAGMRTTTLVLSTDGLRSVADDLGVGDIHEDVTRLPLERGDSVDRLVDDLEAIAASPGLVETPTGSVLALEGVVRALASGLEVPAGPTRRFDSRQIVRDAVDYAEQTGRWQPTMSELCRAAMASESRVRAAFVEVVDVAPTVYFQLRVLSRLRQLLVAADPTHATVTDIAASLGLTQLGRVAGRYRQLYGEVPSETLRRAN